MSDHLRAVTGSEHESMQDTLASLGAGSAVREQLVPLERGDVVGRYVVLEEVGRGAMGVVMAAYDPELDRKVAVKLMPVGHGRHAGARLLREAQAMAKLAHPNVITVHDVGSTDDEVFIAMEFVAGGSLRHWLASERRAWHTIVRRFLEAGEGLAAAHRQGIVHRDFKPDNVLVREDGRACVGDFGLARRDDEVQVSTPSDELRSTLRSSIERNVAQLTATGATMGTPAYMAPEQHLGARVDARSDQFAFCVALWEALAGERPYAGGTLGAITLNVVAGRRQPFPRESKLPSAIRAALERGLSTDPEQRFHSMDELLAVLRAALPEQRRSRRLEYSALALLGAGLLASAWALREHDEGETRPAPPSPCSRAAEQLEEVWDAARRARVEAAFARTDRPYAARSFERVATQLDGVHEQWVASHTHACEATRVYGEQSEELLDRRMSCLNERRNELVALVDVLERADTQVVDDVEQLLLGVAPISTCDDIAALEADVALPLPAQRESVERLRAQLSELEIQRRVRTAASLRERAASLADSAEQLGYAPVSAEALHMHAALLEAAGEFDAALLLARKAAHIATQSGHRRELAELLTLVAWIEGNDHANVELGLWLLDLAAAESAGFGDPVLLAVRIASDRASLLTVKGEYQPALAEFERALALIERELGREHVRADDLRFNIAATHHFLGHFEQAEQGFRAALAGYTARMGPEHPEVAQCHNNLAASLIMLAQLDEAEQHASAAADIWRAVGDDAALAGALSNLGDIAYEQDQLERSLEFEQQAYALKLESFGPDHPTTIGSLIGIGRAEAALGNIEAAKARYHEGIERLRASMGEEHPDLAGMQAGLAWLEQQAR